jgi:hypothetical protein
MKEKIIEIPNDLTNTSGIGKTIIGDKCHSNWTDVECPNDATCQEYHYGQFGHKVLFLFCDKCYQDCLKQREDEKLGWFFTYENRGFEFRKSVNQNV